ncbi:MAG TPA: uroporphyrinogen-III synthase [Steroidobacteraceae bacterium]|jgi:uroporphyrinogen III methyltransferase/synthase
MTRAVVVTRDEPRDGPLGASLRARGLEVLWWPVVRIMPPADPRPFEEALARVAEFDWIVFASKHAVEAVASASQLPPGVRIAAVGAATAAALRGHGLTAEVVPAEAHADALVAALGEHIGPGARVLFPASSRALPTLGEGLRRLGARVVQVEAYRNEGACLDVVAARAAIDAGAVGAVTFTSPSCVDELERALGREAFERLLGEQALAVALGSTTAGALSARGIESVVASPPTLEGLAATTSQVLNGSKH